GDPGVAGGRAARAARLGRAPHRRAVRADRTVRAGAGEGSRARTHPGAGHPGRTGEGPPRTDELGRPPTAGRIVSREAPFGVSRDICSRPPWTRPLDVLGQEVGDTAGGWLT